MTDLSIATIDVDGAVQESAERAGFDTRADFFRKGLLAGGTMLAAGAFGGIALPSIASAATPAGDVAILNFALTLEYLEAEFYKQGVAAKFGGATSTLASTIYAHEDAHVKFLTKALGSAKVARPKFDFGKATTDAATFRSTAYVLENTGVSAYLGQAGKIKTPAILLAAATIATVEARHAGAVAQLIGKKVSPDGSFDVGESSMAILAAVKKTGFIKS
ncbi:MAG TPA: ferritin-like domain-containing protein [Solirubrobacteraceae bacterium]|nr:ferritin-like domain-containing protein [Solirubrobacteraceae bacterium]